MAVETVARLMSMLFGGDITGAVSTSTSLLHPGVQGSDLRSQIVNCQKVTKICKDWGGRKATPASPEIQNSRLL